MAADTVKSNWLTQLDTTWATRDPQSAGFGVPTHTSYAEDYVAATAAGLGNTSSIYKALRLPTTTCLKSINIENPTQLDSGSGLAFDIGAYYSDAVDDGTPAANQGSSISANCFMSNVAFGATAKTRQWGMGNLAANLRTSPLWQQVGLSSDPGGYIDIVLAVHVAAGTGVAGNIIVEATIASV
jgi:hypothetical protein